MDIAKLTAIGLTPQQATAYALLIEHRELKPAAAAVELKLSRTNAYKLYDKLVELGLAHKVEVGKTFHYKLANPMALASRAADYRAEATSREEATQQIMNSLLKSYYKHRQDISIEVVNGPKAVAELYRKQIKIGENIHFIRTRADIPSMGFDTMHELRTAPARHGLSRKGILPVKDANSTVNLEPHARTNLEVTWVEENLYDAPVEWSVTASSLLICSYGNEPQGMLIVDPVIAGAFLQLWSLLNALLVPRAINKTLNLAKLA